MYIYIYLYYVHTNADDVVICLALDRYERESDGVALILNVHGAFSTIYTQFDGTLVVAMTCLSTDLYKLYFNSGNKVLYHV